MAVRWDVDRRVVVRGTRTLFPNRKQLTLRRSGDGLVSVTAHTMFDSTTARDVDLDDLREAVGLLVTEEDADRAGPSASDGTLPGGSDGEY